jgi:hypothetical protein
MESGRKEVRKRGRREEREGKGREREEGRGRGERRKSRNPRSRQKVCFPAVKTGTFQFPPGPPLPGFCS